VIEKFEIELKRLTEVFIKKNKIVNLSSFNDFESVWNKNILDSLEVVNFLDFDFQNALDVGTGGGFPLLPLAICYPDKNWSGIDSVNKKLIAVEDMAAELGLKNIAAFHARVEDFGHDSDFRESFDLVLSRAFAKLPMNLELCLPLVKVGGRFVAMLGPSSQQEIDESVNQYTELGCTLERFECVETEFGTRCFLILLKTANTPTTFPRSTKKIKKEFKIS